MALTEIQAFLRWLRSQYRHHGLFGSAARYLNQDDRVRIRLEACRTLSSMDRCIQEMCPDHYWCDTLLQARDYGWRAYQGRLTTEDALRFGISRMQSPPAVQTACTAHAIWAAQTNAAFRCPHCESIPHSPDLLMNPLFIFGDGVVIVDTEPPP